MEFMVKFIRQLGTLVEQRSNTVAVLLLSLFFFQGYTAALNKSVTVDEFAHLPAGLYYLKTKQFDIYHHNPPLVKTLAALPLLFSPAHLPEDIKGRWAFGYAFMMQNTKRYQQLFQAGRTVILMMGVVLALLIFLFAERVFGTKPALLSLFVMAVSPNMLAHANLVTTDVGCALGIFATLFALWEFFQRPSGKMLCICGIVFGMAQLTKFSALVLIPALPLLMGVHWLYGKRNITPVRMLACFAAILTIGIAVINAGYLFKGSFDPIGTYSFRSSFFSSLQRALPSESPLPFPRDYLEGLDAQKYESDVSPVPVYLLGRLSSKGWWYYYPIALMVKTPLPVLILFGWLVGIVFHRRMKMEALYFHVFALTFIALYLFLFSGFVVNLGIRYLLPIFPFVFLLAGSVIHYIDEKQKVLVSVLSVWLAVSALMIYPHHIAYFNEAAGGAGNGHRILADSNLDWGQDLMFLKKYMDRHRLKSVYLSHFGLVEPAIYGIRYQHLPPVPVKGVIAVSVNHLLGISGWKKIEHLDWLRQRKPDDHAGYSIVIFRTEKG